MLAESAFRALYPSRKMPELEVSFSGRFKEYNANVSIQKFGWTITKLSFSLSKKFLDHEDDLQIGMIQYLLNKVYKTKVNSIEQDLYHSFIKHLPRYARRTDSNSYLVTLFNELNNEYFKGIMEQPNLVFGGKSFSTLGHYNYSTDTVTISSILKDDEHLLKFVLYHELLHKKHGFKTTNNRTHYHTKEFRLDEKKFPDINIEKKLEQFVRKKKRKSLLDHFF
jgi:hypothetical protein